MRKPASTLLLTVISLSAISVVILAASLAFITTARQQSTLLSGQDAELMAQAGIQEAASILKNLDSAGDKGEYPDPKGNLVITDIKSVRVYTDSSCATFEDVSMNSDSNQLVRANCPYYEFAIHSNVLTEEYVLRYKDLAPGSLYGSWRFEGGPSQVTAVRNSELISSFNMYCDGVVEADLTLDINQKCEYLTFDQVVPLAGPPLPDDAAIRIYALTQSEDNENAFIIGKALSTAVVTGYAADGSMSRYLLTMRDVYTFPEIRRFSYDFDAVTGTCTQLRTLTMNNEEVEFDPCR